MAQQYHAAHSKQIMGAGIVAAGPWDCAETRPGWLPLVTAAYVCSHTAEDGLPFLGPPDLAASIAATRAAARARRIDPTKFLAGAKVFLFSGTKDSLEPQSVVDELNRWYRAFVPPGQVKYVNDVPAEHAMATAGHGNACGHLGPPYVNEAVNLSAGLERWIPAGAVPE
jgi:hypothetical protein